MGQKEQMRVWLFLRGCPGFEWVVVLAEIAFGRILMKFHAIILVLQWSSGAPPPFMLRHLMLSSPTSPTPTFNERDAISASPRGRWLGPLRVRDMKEMAI